MPVIELLPDPKDKKRKPYPLNWSEQDVLMAQLPEYLRQMALFAVNTGCRDGEVCNLRWEWEHKIDQLGTSVFVIPAEFVKNDTKRLVVLNSVASEVIESCRGKSETHVFSYLGRPLSRMNNRAWRKARMDAFKQFGGTTEKAAENKERKVPCLSNVRVHDLKHTFGNRLMTAGVSLELRKELLGLKTNDITVHYSHTALQVLFEAAELVRPKSEEDREDVIVLRL